MYGFGLLIALILLPWEAALAAPKIPALAADATAYRRSIEQISPRANAPQLLRAVKAAESAGNIAEISRLYEELVALDRGNFRAWLSLSLVWRGTDNTADKALSAAFNAHEAARSAPEKLEALLVMTSILRTRLDAHRREYDAARVDLEKADLALINARAKGADQRAAPEAAAANYAAQLAMTRKTAEAETEQQLTRIGEVAAALDELYREIALVLPGANAETMKATDSRSTVFAPVMLLGSKKPQITFNVEGETVRGCIEFSQELASGTSYGDHIKVVIEKEPAPNITDEAKGRHIKVKKEPAPGITVEAKGRKLCLSGLKSEAKHEVTLLKGLPAKSGAKLAREVTLSEVEAPPLPETVTFSARRFLLPRTGPGEVPLQVTNLDSVELELFRITDRTLHRHIALNHVGGELPASEFDDLKERFGERMWLGTVETPEALRKKNARVKLGLPVRDLLRERRGWLRQAIAANRGDMPDLSSGRRVISPGGPAEPRIHGEFFAGAPEFEASSLDAEPPGVYALVTSNSNRCEECNEYLVQWFVDTDLGLAFFEGDQNFSVVVRSLLSGAAKPKAKVELVAAGNRVLASGNTDENGVVTFARSVTRGTQSNALAAILVQDGTDFGFMTFGPERLDLSRLNVDGRPLPRGFNAFLTTDRGIYQPGERVEIVALLRNEDGRVPDQVPMANVRAEARDRTLAQWQIEPSHWKLGGTRVHLDLPQNVRSGALRIALSLGGDINAVVGETIVHVGPIRPDRVALRFEPEREWLARGVGDGTLEVTGHLNAQYLFLDDKKGPARDLKAEVVARLSPSETPVQECYAEFAFGRLDDKTLASSSRQFLQFTDRDGNLDLRMTGIEIPLSTKPLSATVEVTLFEPAGPLGSNSLALPVIDPRGWIGLSKTPRVRAGSTPGTQAIDVDVVRLTRNNAAEGVRKLTFALHREHDEYSWERRNDAWQHNRTPRLEPLVTTTVSSTDLRRGAGPAQTGGPNCVRPERFENFADNLEVGRYVLSVRDDETGMESSLRFNVGEAGTDANLLEPNLFQLSSDKKTYRPGEVIELTADVPFDGEVLVGFAQGDIRHWAAGSAKNSVAKIRFVVPPEWVGKGVHALATVFRSGADERVTPGPGRAVGATFFTVGGERAGYSASVGFLEGARRGHLAPDEELAFRVCIEASPLESQECSQGTEAKARNVPEEAYAVAFVVDEGLLRLTGHLTPPPDPQRHFYARQRLGVRMMDNYDRLLLKTGGDRPGRLAVANYVSDRVVALAEGPFIVRNGRAEIRFKSPGFPLGRASVFVIVWSADFATATLASVPVRSQVIADLGAPKFLLSGERALLPLRLQNTGSMHEGEFIARVTASGVPAALSILGAGPDSAAEAGSGVVWRTTIRQGEVKTSYLALEARAGSQGDLKLAVEIDAVGSPHPLEGRRREWSLKVAPPALSNSETVTFPVTSTGANLARLTEELIAGRYDPESVTVTVSFADTERALLSAVPFGGQPSIRPILRHLVLQGTALLHQPSGDAAQRREIIRIIGEILSLQLPDGSFIPYRTLGNPTPAELSYRIESAASPADGEEDPANASLERRGGVDRAASALESDGEEDPANASLVRRSGVYRTASALDVLLAGRAAGYDVPEANLKAARVFLKAAITDAEDSCSFDVAYAWFVLIEMGGVRQEDVDEISSCSNQDPLAKAVTAAVLARFGRSDQAQTVLASFSKGSENADEIKSLGQVRLAMALSFLAEAGAPAAVTDPLAEMIVSGSGHSLSAAASAWIAKATNRVAPSALTISDLRIDGSTLGVLRATRHGVLQAAGMRLSRLRQAPVTVASIPGRTARGIITVEGLLTAPDQGNRLPGRSLKRRVFDDKGREINPATERLNVGDRLVIVLEGYREGLSKILPTNEETEESQAEPILLADLLPSAFKIISSTALGRSDLALPAAVRSLEPKGDLRSVETDANRWVALVVPESRRPQSAASRQAAPPPDDLEFRLGYLVRVNMGGRFTLPGTLLEPTTGLTSSYRAENSSINVRLPEAEPQ